MTHSKGGYMARFEEKPPMETVCAATLILVHASSYVLGQILIESQHAVDGSETLSYADRLLLYDAYCEALSVLAGAKRAVNESIADRLTT